MIISFANMKGGVGKSTSAHAVALGLHQRGKRVLICDADPQANVTNSAGIDILSVDCTLRDIFRGRDIHDGIRRIREGLDLVTAGIEMINADTMFSGIGREYLLRKALQAVSGEYDYIIVDTYPYLGLLTTGALVASDMVVIPTTADAYSLLGVQQLQGLIDNVKESPYNPGLRIGGLLVTMYNDRTVLSRVIETSLQETAVELGTKVYRTRIRRSQAIQDAQFLQEDIYEVGSAKGIEDYKDFVDELMEDMGK